MAKTQRTGPIGLASTAREFPAREPPPLKEIFGLLGIDPGSGVHFSESLPFSLNDATAGSENELQAAVLGSRHDVDLPISIEHSGFYANIVRRIQSGDTPRTLASGLQSYLKENAARVWENSWVRFPVKLLSESARKVLEHDLLADKRNPHLGPRHDLDRFLFYEGGEKHLRVPLSYLIKLSLAEVLGSQEHLPALLSATGRQLLNHFSNDNTSPETFSFHVVPLRSESGMGQAIARETSRRFLLTQLLVMYANRAFRLDASGQHATIYFAPNPPVRQRELNDCISDSFYREIFMSPCLSGWDKGEEKHRYMALCHQVLSRSQLNATAKLREAGIVTRNLVTLPNMSNISLANNGTHVSLGSRKLAQMLADPSSGFTATHEKAVGDLAIKIVEHFLPLFVGTYTAAPYRLDFADLHPEKALGFLPHELDYTHLRMIWRRWKGKADIRFFGHPVTPFGPAWLDAAISRILKLRGDFIPDFRLIDYFVALLSTESSPALDGRCGNGDRLKQDLADMGVFDTKMALYLLYRQREYGKYGFSGFEARYYSLFHSLAEDMAHAANLQVLINALAFKYMAKGIVHHGHIPDSPSIESERRQIFFGTAIGIPTFYVRSNTSNLFLKQIVSKCRRVRHSRRYPGYLRVVNTEYRKALIALLREDASDLIEILDLADTLSNLEDRIATPHVHSACVRLTSSVLDGVGAKTPMSLSAKEFNLAAEHYYRNGLRHKHLMEALAILREEYTEFESGRLGDDSRYRATLRYTPGHLTATEFLRIVGQEILDDTASLEELRTLINLTLVLEDRDCRNAAAGPDATAGEERHETSICGAEHWQDSHRTTLRRPGDRSVPLLQIT